MTHQQKGENGSCERSEGRERGQRKKRKEKESGPPKRGQKKRTKKNQKREKEEKQPKIEEGRPSVKKKDESHFWELQVQKSIVHEDYLRLFHPCFSSLCGLSILL